MGNLIKVSIIIVGLLAALIVYAEDEGAELRILQLKQQKQEILVNKTAFADRELAILDAQIAKLQVRRNAIADDKTGYADQRIKLIEDNIQILNNR